MLAGGPPCLQLSVIGFSFSWPRTKGPLRGCGEAAPRQLSALAAPLGSPKDTRSPLRQEGSGDLLRHGEKKLAREEKKGGLRANLPPARGRGCAAGTPRTLPLVSASSFQSLPSIRPRGRCSVASPGAGSCPGGRTQRWHFVGLAEPPPLPPATGQRDSPQPAVLSLGGPSPCRPLRCPRAGGCASFLLEPCHEASGMLQRRRGHGTGSADPKRTAGPAWCRAESAVRHGGGPQKRPSCPPAPLLAVSPSPCAAPGGVPESRRPRRASRSGCCSRRGSGRCTW